MSELIVTITRFVDDAQPGFVLCEFYDADQRRHTMLEKVPVVSPLALDRQGTFPQPGAIRCRVIGAGPQDPPGTIRVTIAVPDAAESSEGITEFVVLTSQIV